MVNNDFTFEITEKVGVLRVYSNEWRKELNVVSWNGAMPKFDIRDWNPDHTVMTRGVTFDKGEGLLLCHMLEDYFKGGSEE